ncbi:MAG: methyltransferase domain-containing protein [Bacteroidales bacterium]|nr:methyltransferase domain-containing protein [Bacteroidales bacterium]
MNKAYYQIKDQCRQGLLQYLEKAFTLIPKKGAYKMLDIGCGTGVPTLCMAEHFSGFITAIDTDKPALDFFQDKLAENKLKHPIRIQEVSLFDFTAEKNSFDILLAEGFLNVVGFETGFAKALEFLKPGGYFIIHDELKDHESKIDFMAHQNCTLSGSFYVDETIWWNNYYSPLDSHIKSISDQGFKACFASDSAEIAYFETDQKVFRSIYYIICSKKL